MRNARILLVSTTARLRLGRAVFAALLVGACSQPPSSNDAQRAATATQPQPLAAAPAAPPTTVAKAGKHGEDEPFMVQTEPFTDSQKAFATAKDALLTKYYAAGLTEDDVYRAAVRGMVEDVDARMHQWNKLLSPSDLELMNTDLKGQLVGIGVMIEFDDATGHIEIQNTIPGGPAEKAGLQAHDVILSVNGKLYKGKTLIDAVHEMRGKAGDPVALSVLRDDKILPFNVVRAPVQMQVTQHFLVDGIGYLRVAMFSDTTAAGVKAALDDFASSKVKGIVLDLRENGGGSFDAAVKTAELFLPSGAPIVTLERREGKKETMTSKGSPALATTPMVVLVDHGTSSGAELLTGALSEGRHARTVGMRTYGKWSVQSVDELGNGYALKYTTALFHTPSGATYDGTGLAPEIEVDADKEAVERACMVTDPVARVAKDGQLRTALSLLK